MITDLISASWLQKLGWALLHFLWQGTAIAAFYAICRYLLPSFARARYAISCAALACMMIAPVLTFFLLPDPAAISTNRFSAPTFFHALPEPADNHILAAVVMLWILGVLAFSIRLFGGWRCTVLLRSTSVSAPAEWQHTLGAIAARIGAEQVSLRISSRVDVPAVIGWLRPVILVPTEFFIGLPVEQVTALLAHEVAHIRRHDYLISMLQSVAEAVLFYHPGVWWISEQLRVERELCCDDLAVAACGDVFTYAQALASLESRHLVRNRYGLAANGGALLNRIRRLIEPAKENHNTFPRPGAAWAMTLLWLAGIGVAAVHAARPPAAALPLTTLEPLPLSTRPADLSLITHAWRTLLFDPLALPRPAGIVRLAQNTQPDSQLVTTATPWNKWVNQDVAYLITQEERRAFGQLQTDDERAQFMEQFWARRDPTPDTVENEYREEHYRRIAWANEHFASRIPGWKTDRGLIYVRFGPPDEMESHPSQFVSAPATQDWKYKYIPQVGNNVNVHFADTTGAGEYHLTIGPSDPDLLKDLTPPQLAALAIPNQPVADDANENSNALPMQARVDYVRATSYSTLANITLQFEGKDKSPMNLLGRVTTLTRRPVSTFENAVIASDKPALYQQSVPLPPGRYRAKLIAKDTTTGNLGSYEMALDVPAFADDKLASSSLILADSMEHVPAKDTAASMFVIGDVRVRPRIGNKFSPGESMGIYLQLYNFAPDSLQKPAGSIEYEIDAADSGARVISFSEEVGNISNVAPDQVTVEKQLALRTFAPGNYLLRITATDRVRNQTVQQQSSFTVIAAP